MDLNTFILRIKRGETPFYRLLKTLLAPLQHQRLPRVPGFLKPPLRVVYEAHFLVLDVSRSLVTTFYRHPLFQARCTTFGKNVHLDGLPYVNGHVEIHIGNEVWIGGRVGISTGRMVDRPRLILEDRSEVGWNTSISVSKEVVIEEGARVSYDCRISDGDGHPKEADLRLQNMPPPASEIRPVRICRYAWIGNGTHIMKGVTIGEGAIIGANSVVVSNIPAYSMAMGNPAEVYFRNYGRPSQKNDENGLTSGTTAAAGT